MLFSQQVGRAVEETVRQRAEAREIACEAAVQSGVFGVLEEHHKDGSITFSLSATVPFGHIHEVRR